MSLSYEKLSLFPKKFRKCTLKYSGVNGQVYGSHSQIGHASEVMRGQKAGGKE